MNDHYSAGENITDRHTTDRGSFLNVSSFHLRLSWPRALVTSSDGRFTSRKNTTTSNWPAVELDASYIPRVIADGGRGSSSRQ